jgi:hypothetical protein
MEPLKALAREAVPAALAKAEHYRLLNEPGEAESICLDVLRVDPDNQQALVVLLLALTDQFEEGLADRVKQARDVLPRLSADYPRAYYAGIICERQAKAQLKQGSPVSGYLAYDSLRDAMGWYERAETLRPPGNDDALLRWNTCVRILARNPHIQPEPVDRSEPPLE